MHAFPRKVLPLLMLLCLVGPAWSMGGDGGRGGEPSLTPELRAEWAPVLEEGRRHGPLLPDWEHTVAHLAGAGLSPADGEKVLDPGRQATQEGLPAAVVLSKLNEGALKGVSAAGLLQAAETRLASLRQAESMLQRSGLSARGDRGNGLLVAVALALESGVPAATMASALERGRGAPTGQVRAVVEAGEALHLEGLNPETVGALMEDCLDRQLRRPEVLRVVRFAREQHARGLDGNAIRATLWGGADGGGPGGGGPRGPAGGQGSTSGTGMGGPGMGGQGGMGGNRPPRGGPR